jgi:pyruvate,water dikinase
MKKNKKFTLWFKEISKKDVALVGGKNASLGEMLSALGKKGVRVPDGFALTASAYWHFLKANKIDKKLKEIFNQLDRKNFSNLKEVSSAAQKLILKSSFPPELEKEIIQKYKQLSQKYGAKETDVAVRSSATAEDTKTASFAGQMETYLNVKGEKELLLACKKCMASLFTQRAIAYREEKGFNHLKIALSVGVQKMVRSDLGSSGVMFTLDTESGFEKVVLINSIWGVGEMIVKGKVIPDEFYVFKPALQKGYRSLIMKKLGRKSHKYIYSKKGGLVEVKVPKKEQNKFSLSEDDALTLARWAMVIEKHYNSHQDIEWAKDGKTKELFIVQARPETVHSLQLRDIYKEYEVKTEKQPILRGTAIGDKIGEGKARVILSVSDIKNFKKGEVLVTDMTDPDWVPAMRVASAIITNKGGRTCHAAIVARELGIPAVTGTEKATKILKTGQYVTVDCTQGINGRIFEGKINYRIKKYNLKKLKPPKTKIMVNAGTPETAFKISFLPVQGVGLAREEFIIAEKIKIHPLALYWYGELKKKGLKSQKIVQAGISNSELKKIIRTIDELTVEYKDKKDYFIKELAEGIAQIAAAFWPYDVIVRFSDFKTNEYRELIGGELFEPEEENPMLGWRGASRYYDAKFKPAFLMECEAIKRVRDVFGLKNVKVMVPFCRTVEEGKRVLKIIEEAGLKKGKEGLKIYVMCEIPSNVILADEFLKIFDGFSIGSNDLTQLTLGIDRDNATLQKIGDERNEAVKALIKQAIKSAKKRKKYCGICGQGPSDFPELAEFLVKEGIESISLNPDTVIKTILNLTEPKSSKRK